MGSAPFIEPVNKIVIAGGNVDRRGYTTSGTVTNLKPGRLVKTGASDSLIIIGAADSLSVGFLGYEDAFAPDRPANITTAYATAEKCDVISGPGTILVAYGSAAIVKGARVAAAADGKVTTFVDATMEPGTIVGIAEETTAAAGNVIIRSLI